MWLWVVGVCLAAMVATYVMFVEPPPPRRLVMAGGGRGGAYHRFAVLYAEELRREGLTLEIRDTAGSVENLKLLGDDKSGVSLAIVQSGVAGETQGEKVFALGSLYREPLWLFHRAEKPVGRLGDLKGARIGVGADGSGTQAVTLRMLAANGLTEREGSPGSGPGARLFRHDAANAAEALRKGELDAAFFVAAFEADSIRSLLEDDGVRLYSFERQEAYRRRFRFLAPVTLPAGIVDLAQDLPAKDVALLAPTAMLAVRADFHPALVPVLLTAARRIHGKGDVLNEPREFPSASYCDLPVGEDAQRFYTSGQPVLQRILPFWVASIADRAKLMLIPLVMLAMPLFRAAPPLIRWRTRRKIYRWYGTLRDVDQRLAAGISGDDLGRQIERLSRIEHQVVWLDVPLSYMEEFYHLRMHLGMLQRRLAELRAGGVGDPDATVE